jgi:hypothetical protein
MKHMEYNEEEYYKALANQSTGYGWGYGGYGAYNNRIQSQFYKTEVEKLDDKEIMRGYLTAIKKEKELDNIIWVEPHVFTKMKHMMYSMPKLEIFGKLLIDIEDDKLIVVKDILIPYQTVTSTSFNTIDDEGENMMGKWLDEIQRNEDGSFKDIEYCNKLVSQMLGHFHSHYSVGTKKGTSLPSPSTTDTEDMKSMREGKIIWVEIIGNGVGFSGRVTIDKPTPMLVKAEVREKWWTGFEDTYAEMQGKIYEEVDITPEKKTTTKSPGKGGNKVIEVKSKSKGHTRKLNLNLDLENDSLVGETHVCVPHNPRNPLEVDNIMLDTSDLAELNALLYGTLINGEQLYWEVHNDEVVRLVIHDEMGFIETMGERSFDIPQLESDVEKILDTYDLATPSVNFTTIHDEANQLDLDRTLDFVEAVQTVYTTMMNHKEE